MGAYSQQVHGFIVGLKSNSSIEDARAQSKLESEYVIILYTETHTQTHSGYARKDLQSKLELE